MGRAAEVAALRQSWSDARQGSLQMATIGGQPGIGKTRLAAHLARLAHRAGARVLYGRSEAELAIPVQAFAEVFSEFATRASEAELTELGEGTIRTLARIVPTLRDHLRGDAAPDRGPAPDHELFHAGATLLAVAARRRPLLLILDDVQWADRPTALMLRYLLSHPEPIPALVLATYRSTEVEPGSTVASTLLDLERRPNVVDLILEGLDPAESISIAGGLAGHALQGAELTLAELVHAETEGNPLFLTQLLRGLSEGGAIDHVAGRWALQRRIETVDLPATVSETIRRRVEQLGADVAAILATAAVLGVEFDVDVLHRIADCEQELLDLALDAATAAGIVARTGDAGQFVFTHPLIPRVLYDGIGDASRGRAHRRAALALEEVLGGGSRARASQLARHWLEALPADRDQAREWARRAGEEALAQFESEAAARWFSRALELDGAPAEGTRYELLIGLGVAQRLSGQAEFRETLLDAARLADAVGDPARLVEAALANNRGFASASGTVDSERIAILELAIERIGPEDSRPRALLLATLAAELSFSGVLERRCALSDEALAIARRLGDEEVLCRVLTARFVPIWMPETLPERLANSEENVHLADRLGSPQEQFGAVHWHSVALLQAGKIDAAVAAVDREQGLARRLADPTALWIATYDRGNLATVFGRLDEAESLANEAFEIAGAAGQPDALPFFGSQIANIRYEQGRLSELQELLAQVVAENPGLPAFRAVLALAYVEGGLNDEARGLLAMELESEFEEIPPDVTWLAGQTIYAHVSAELEEPAAAELLYDRIAPFAEQIVYTGISSWGDGDHALGRLATVRNRFDEAERHLDASRSRARAIGAALWSVRATIDTARLLLRRDGPEDANGAVELLGESADEARRLGAAPLATRADNLLAHARAKGRLSASPRTSARLRLRNRAPLAASDRGNGNGHPKPSAPAEDLDPRRAQLRCEGDSWSLDFQGRTLRLRDVKGVRYLAMLLSNPGVERHAVDLQSGPVGRAADGADGAIAELSVRAADGDAGAVLDPQAKREYRHRIEELREEVEEAEGFNDPERASRAREELEFLGRELAAAVGIGGRDRKAASTAERARVNVTRAIRKAVQRIAELDEDLGDHLERSLQTGSFCVYRPAAAEALEWEVEGAEVS